MFLSRVVRCAVSNPFTFEQATRGSSPKLRADRANFEAIRKEKAHQLLEQVNSDLKANRVNHDYWNKLQSSKEIYSLRFTSTNFENKFLDLIYDFKLENRPLLESLRSYFLARNIDKNVIQKCAYGHLLLMMQDAQYDKQIERIYSELKADRILSEPVCTNFLFAYCRSSKERFERCFDYLYERDFGNIEVEKRLHFFDIAMEYDKQDRFMSMFRLFIFNDKVLLAKFIEWRDRFKEEASFVKLLRAINDAGCALQTRDIDYICDRMRQFNYNVTPIQPTTFHCPKPEEIQTLKRHFVAQFQEQAKLMPDPKARALIYSYLQFLKNLENQFNLVIDGLNLGFQGSLDFNMVKRSNRGGIELTCTSKTLEANIVNQLNPILRSGQYRRVLFIGRYSQSYYTQLMALLNNHNIKFRFFRKEVEDDMSVILAALFNENARIATNDYFSDYEYRMRDDQMKLLFRKFLGVRCVTFKRRNQAINYFNEGWIKTVHHNPQTNSLHIPFDNESITYKHLYAWYCFVKNDRESR